MTIERVRREMLQKQCQDARAALLAAGIGEGETLADGISELASRLADAEIRGAAEALRSVLDLHAPIQEQYYDAQTGAPAGSAVECEYCSEVAGDGVDYPCATARAAGVAP